MTGRPAPLAARPHEPELAGPYRKDAVQEAFLAELNGHLAGFETDRYEPLEETLPTLHVIGAPRSGTTLLHQVIATGLEVQSATNLVAAFWRAPVTGIRLARALDVQAVDSSFTSTFGRTRGLVEPHEFGYFWNHHLGYPDLAERGPEHETTIDWDRLAQVIRNMAAAAQAPLTFKPMLLTWHLERMVRAMPRTCYVWIRRDRVATAVSLLGMRRRMFGADSSWASLRPLGITDAAPPWQQVAEQVVALERTIEAAALRLGPDHVLEVTYDELCADPAATLHRVRDLMGRHGHAPALREHDLGPFAPDPSETLAAEFGDRVAAALAELER